MHGQHFCIPGDFKPKEAYSDDADFARDVGRKAVALSEVLSTV